VLVGGMRVLNANYRQSPIGVFTKRPETLTNDFFVNLLDMGTTWQPTSEGGATFEGRESRDGRAQVDRQPCRPRLRLELAVACNRGGLRQRRLTGEVRARLRCRVDKVMTSIDSTLPDPDVRVERCARLRRINLHWHDVRHE